MSANKKPDGLESELARRAAEIGARVDAINLRSAHEAGQAGGGLHLQDGMPAGICVSAFAASGGSAPPPRADADDASRGCTVAFCERHRAVEVVAGPFCPACSLGDTLRDGVKMGRESAPRADAAHDAAGGRVEEVARRAAEYVDDAWREVGRRDLPLVRSNLIDNAVAAALRGGGV